MNFGSTNWLNQKRSLGTQQNVTIFLQYFISSYGGFWSDILLLYFRVMLHPQHFHNKS